MNPGLVIVGSGLAGYTLAREWRKRDKTAALTVISRDHGGFYSKPMLSNALASGKAPAALVTKDAAAMASELNATVLAQCQVTHIDTAGQQLQLADGRTLPYRDLVLATGADPIRLPLAGEGAAAVRSVNDQPSGADTAVSIPEDTTHAFQNDNFGWRSRLRTHVSIRSSWAMTWAHFTSSSFITPISL